ncbi:MAG: bifunctional phosphoribosylaminoimidazolecarboxamide formyltransferase/IMP cyclohydrolase [Rickettsiella sp.]|nr:bifunctional phosphoribosylaminoimidazolecarboxamide formyltransferase/IMP cyclohydrolase [Rickettsiella sp.]
MFNIAILGSTRGSYLHTLTAATTTLSAKIALVVSDRQDAPILERAKTLDVPSLYLDAKGLTREVYAEKLDLILHQHRIDVILLVGFMRILAKSLTQKWQGKILNVHPSLLPRYAGLMDLQVHQAVLTNGDSETGCTVHEVTDSVDDGKILVQKKCTVNPQETPESLKTKVQALEKDALLQALHLSLPRPIHTALISVADKTHLIDFASNLHRCGVTIISTGGTAKALRAANIPITLVTDITDFPEIMAGRVKTLHPKIHGAILGRRDQHANEAKTHAINWIDLVVVNLYPFQTNVAQGESTETIIENIDIGGPAMLRAAAKNHLWVSAVHDPADYPIILNELQAHQGIKYTTRQTLAAKAFAHTAYYDSEITHYLNAAPFLSRTQWMIPLKRCDTLRYGENPHQQAALFHTPFGFGLAQGNLIQGKALSYNNLVDAEAALQCVRNFNAPACVVVKHANPCGAAVADDIEQAYKQAFHADKQSAFGGIIALNRPCTQTIAQHLSEVFMEVILAPAFSQDAQCILAKKPNCRVLALADWGKINLPFNVKAISGGLLVQSSDQHQLITAELETVTTKIPSTEILKELLFAWQIVKYLKSNAIAITKNHVTLGLSGGHVSRIDALKFALHKSSNSLTDAVLASDAFFPFRDSIDALANTGIKAIIQPGGSVRDSEVIAACNEYEIAMVFTHTRCFNH